MNEEQAVSKVDGILLNYGIEKESELCVLNLIRWVAFLLGGTQFLKTFHVYYLLCSFFPWTLPWMFYSYTATTKCSPSVDRSWSLSLGESIFLEPWPAHWYQMTFFLLDLQVSLQEAHMLISSVQQLKILRVHSAGPFGVQFFTLYHT